MPRPTKALIEEREALAAQGLKRCASSGCGQVKPVEDFGKDRSKWDALAIRCRSCDCAKTLKHYAEHTVERCEYQRDYYRTRRAEDPLWQRLKFGAYRARKAGVLVDSFTSDDLREHWKSKGWNETQCSYCLAEVTGRDFHLDHDRPISEGGAHAVENIRPACSRCNTSKQNQKGQEYADRWAQAFADIAAEIVAAGDGDLVAEAERICREAVERGELTV